RAGGTARVRRGPAGGRRGPGAVPPAGGTPLPPAVPGHGLGSGGRRDGPGPAEAGGPPPCRGGRGEGPLGARRDGTPGGSGAERAAHGARSEPGGYRRRGHRT